MIRLRRRDRIRAALGAPTYPVVDWAPGIVLRHQPWDMRDPHPTRHTVTWWWKRRDWDGPVWQQIPTDPTRRYELVDIERLLRVELDKYPGMDLTRKR